MTTVHNLRTGAEQAYSCTPREAVIAAYAQERGDWNTWNYAATYGDMVTTGGYSVACGDWAALL